MANANPAKKAVNKTPAPKAEPKPTAEGTKDPLEKYATKLPNGSIIYDFR